VSGSGRLIWSLRLESDLSGDRLGGGTEARKEGRQGKREVGRDFVFLEF
jgi:hypothetical protein